MQEDKVEKLLGDADERLKFWFEELKWFWKKYKEACDKADDISAKLCFEGYQYCEEKLKRRIAEIKDRKITVEIAVDTKSVKDAKKDLIDLKEEAKKTKPKTKKGGKNGNRNNR